MPPPSLYINILCDSNAPCIPSYNYFLLLQFQWQLFLLSDTVTVTVMWQSSGLRNGGMGCFSMVKSVAISKLMFSRESYHFGVKITICLKCSHSHERHCRLWNGMLLNGYGWYAHTLVDGIAGCVTEKWHATQWKCLLRLEILYGWYAHTLLDGVAGGVTGGETNWMEMSTAIFKVDAVLERAIHVDLELVYGWYAHMLVDCVAACVT